MSLKKEVCKECYKVANHEWSEKIDSLWERGRSVPCTQIPNSATELSPVIAKVYVSVDADPPIECIRKDLHGIS